MSEPQKPFACTLPSCGMAFTNEDHLHVHTKKHDMVLQLGEQKTAFVDQTPTPTRFIKNCEEVGLFQDLQIVSNPFDEGFKRALETKSNLCIEVPSSDDVLHTPQMVFPQDDTALYSSTNNQNITISRSSSDESGAIKEYETTTISKLTNKVTTISRVRENNEDRDRSNENEKIYRNDIIKIQSNVEIRKDHIPPMSLLGTFDHRQPIMSQRSIDYVVDSLTSEGSQKKNSKKNDLDYEVLIKLPNSKLIKMKAVQELDEEKTVKQDTKEKLKKVIHSKNEPKINLPISGTLHPVTVIRPVTYLIPAKMPIPVNVGKTAVTGNNPLFTGNNQVFTGNNPVFTGNNPVFTGKSPVVTGKVPINAEKVLYTARKAPKVRKMSEEEDFCIQNHVMKNESKMEFFDIADVRSQRSAASKRYRERLKTSMQSQQLENQRLKEANQKLVAENASLKAMLIDHIKICPNSADLSTMKNYIIMPKPAQKRPS